MIVLVPGLGCERSPGKAMFWYRKSAKQNNMWAQTNLGVLYSEGIGVRRKYSEAVRLFRLAAEQGHARAQAKLAAHLETGKGCNKDLEQAFSWYLRAAEGGSVQAMYHVGAAYERGQGCDLDREQAARWFEKAAAWGDTRKQTSPPTSLVTKQFGVTPPISSLPPTLHDIEITDRLVDTLTEFGQFESEDIARKRLIA
ncbi:hypothetical protein HDU93_002643 [Gonapodya sp. JEL0774]|nr:hypothetical protein HDU93_002643 [Gonapodya sp. JEL0774]